MPSPPRRGLRAARTLFLLALVLGLAACGKDEQGKAGGPGGGQPAVVTTTVLAPAPWSDSLEAIGTASARESVALTAKVSETVTDVRFDSGQSVKKGQVLVVLSRQAQAAGLDEAAATHREAQALFERQQALAARQLVSASQLDAQRAARDAARGRLELLRAQSGDRVISAPFDGVLGLRQVSPGTLVTPGTVITTVDDVSLIKLDFSVPESQLSALAVGQAVEARSDAFPGQVFAGTVAAVGSRVDPMSRSLSARAEIPNPDGDLRPGMMLRVRLALPARTALQVPELSLQQVGQQAFVFRVQGDKVEQVPVRIGARRPGWVEILEGVRAGDKVVVEGIVKLKSGARIVEAAGGGAAAGGGTPGG
jgi:membrane fusion protein (multidrug efflux system)